MSWDGNDCVRRYIRWIENEIERHEEDIEESKNHLVSIQHSIDVDKNNIEDLRHIALQLKEVLKRNGFADEEKKTDSSRGD